MYWTYNNVDWFRNRLDTRRQRIELPCFLVIVPQTKFLEHKKHNLFTLNRYYHCLSIMFCETRDTDGSVMRVNRKSVKKPIIPTSNQTVIQNFKSNVQDKKHSKHFKTFSHLVFYRYYFITVKPLIHCFPGHFVMWNALFNHRARFVFTSQLLQIVSAVEKYLASLE